MNSAGLADRVALVSGASRGIGAGIALALGRAGATVVGTATTATGAERISTFLDENDVRGRGTVLDVTDAGIVEAVVRDIAGAEGPVTILVNNAGITRDGLLLRMKPDDWDQILDTNLSAIYRTSRACLRGMMKARHGRIVNIASVVGLMGNAGQCNYAAAKAGMVGFAKSLAREVGARGITVNTVAPGFIDTDMTRALDEKQRATLTAGIPLGRLGQAEDVAAAVCFLASPAGGYITGETLNVNGGLYMA